MQKALALAAFLLVSLTATSAYAQSTISPVPGAADAPHQPSPTTAPDQQITGQQRSDGQLMPDNRSQSKGKKMRAGTMPGSMEGGKKMKMKKHTTTTGSM